MSKEEDTEMDNTRGVSTSSSMEFVRGEEIPRNSEHETITQDDRAERASICDARYDFRVTRGRVPN